VSKADTQPQLHPALLRLSAMISQHFIRHAHYFLPSLALEVIFQLFNVRRIVLFCRSASPGFTFATPPRFHVRDTALVVSFENFLYSDHKPTKNPRTR
jgi:hypothetical protein